MKSKLVEAGKPIEVEIPASLGGAGGKKLSLTILEEIPAGDDRRVYKVKDQHENLYAYKYTKKRLVQKEVERTEAVSKAGVPYARMVASGRDAEERGAGYILREWTLGRRADDWLRDWENFGAPLQTEGALNLFSFLDTLARKGLYIGKLDPEDMVFCPDVGSGAPAKPGWTIVDCGGIREIEPRAAADRYFWKFIERWGMKLDRHGQAFTNLFTLLAPLGKGFPASVPPFGGRASPGHLKIDAELEKADIQDAYDDDDDDDDDDDEDDEDDGESENLSEAKKFLSVDQTIIAVNLGEAGVNGRVVSPTPPPAFGGTGPAPTRRGEAPSLARDSTITVGDETIEYGSTEPGEAAKSTVEEGQSSGGTGDNPLLKNPGEAGVTIPPNGGTESE